MHNPRDLHGKQFGRWMVLRRARSSLDGHARWVCECSCEAHTIRQIDEHNLRCGSSQSCGCLRREALASDPDDPPKTIFDALELDGHRGQVVDTETLASYKFVPAEPEKPCGAIPGTPAKIQALAERAENGQALFHPDDRTCFDDASTAESLDNLPVAVPKRAKARKYPRLGCTRKTPVEHTSGVEEDMFLE